jgi:hypothetical protein
LSLLPYLVAQLPALVFTAAPPLGVDEYGGLARRFLAPADADLLNRIRLLPPADEWARREAAAGSAVLAGYYDWETELRNEWTRLRAPKLGRDAAQDIRPGAPDYSARTAARAALAAASPLEGEILLERGRWDRIDALRTGHFLDLETLVAYGLQLRILHRKAAFVPDRGTRTFEGLRRALLASAPDVQVRRTEP